MVQDFLHQQYRDVLGLLGATFAELQAKALDFFDKCLGLCAQLGVAEFRYPMPAEKISHLHPLLLLKPLPFLPKTEPVETY